MDASLRAFVVERSAGHCEYCQIPNRAVTQSAKQLYSATPVSHLPKSQTNGRFLSTWNNGYQP